MIQKIRRPISILLAILMIVGMFTVLPISAGATDYDQGAMSVDNLVTGDTLTASSGNTLYLNCYGYSVIFKGGTYRERRDYEPQANDTQFQAGQVTSLFIGGDHNGPLLTVMLDGDSSDYYPLDAEGNVSDKWYVLSNENNTITLAGYVPAAPATYVAQIGTTKYETLADAFAAAVDGDTITLLANCAGDGIKVTPAGKFATGLTVDFAGFTYTVDGETVGSTGTETNGFQLLKNNKVTFTNGTITSTKAKILVQNYSDLTLNKMTLTLNNPNYSGAYTLSNNNGNIVINETTINANPAGGFAFDVCRFSSYPSVHVTVTGGSQINGDVEISASGSNAKDGFSLNLESGNINDGDIVVTPSAAAAMAADSDKASVNKAETFTQEAPAGYKWVADGEGKQTLVPDYAAEVNGTGYMTFAEAAAARSSNDDVITLLKDAPAYVMSSNETLKVVKNGFKFSTPTVEGAYVVKSTTANGVTTYTVAEADIEYTSSNGTVSYKTFSSSVISSSGTYKLLKDVNATARIAPGILASNVTLDLNGHTLTSTAADYGILLSRAGSAASPKTFNLVDTSAEKGGKFVASSADQAIAVGGKYNTVTIGEGVTVEGCVALTSENQTLTVNGTINGGNVFAIATNGSATKNATITINDGAKVTSNVTAIYLPGTGTTTINGGEITGATGIYQKSGTLNVKGGTITGNGAAVDFAHNGNGAVATGDAIVVESCNYPGGAPTTTISGGTIVSTNAKQIGDYTYQAITAPAITATSDTLTLPEGLKWIPTETEGVYTIGEIPYVAQNTTTDAKYETLEAAFAAAQDGDTIKVLADCSGNGIKVLKNTFKTKGLTVDFDGHTYNHTGVSVGSPKTETQAFQLLKDNKITFKNGTLYSEKAKMLVQNYSNLTLDGMTLTLNNTGYNGAYTLSNNNGNVVINGTTINANPTTGSFAFDVCRFSNYPSVHVTVTGNSHIKGDVEISATKGNARDGFSLTLESGDMTGNIVVDASAQALVGEDNKVTKKDNFTQDPAEGYEWKDNGDGTSYLAKIQKLFDSYSITLNGNVNLNFYIDTDAIPGYANASSVTAVFTWDSGVVEYGKHYGDDVAVVDLKTPAPDANGLVKAYVPVNAAQMAHQIHAIVYVDNVALAETNDYSVMEYAKTIINGNYPEKTKTLVKEMLNYGAMAQKVFGEQHKDPGALANSVLSATDLNAISEEMSNVNSDTIIGAVKAANGDKRGATIADLQSIGTSIGGKWYTTSVIFLNGNTLRHYFDDEKQGAMNHEGAAGVQDDWFYYVEKKDIVAKDLDTLYTFTIGGVSFQYSVLDYAAAILDSNMGTDAENLAKALYLYNQAANAYFVN